MKPGTRAILISCSWSRVAFDGQGGHSPSGSALMLVQQKARMCHSRHSLVCPCKARQDALPIHHQSLSWSHPGAHGCFPGCGFKQGKVQVI